MALGERILAELGGRQGANTLTRWLVHHVARLIEDADRARTDGAADADRLAADARSAILDLWAHRTTWPNGWPPPRATELVRLLDGLPKPGDPVWIRINAFGQIHALHHQVLAALLDVVTGADDVEQGWLETFGDALTPDEVVVLSHAAQAPRRLGALADEPVAHVDTRTEMETDAPAPDAGNEVLALQRAVKLASDYHDVVAQLVERAFATLSTASTETGATAEGAASEST